jgi:hypothetical protein
VLTASVVQVRRPLYRDALDRESRYRHHLAPLLAELSGISSNVCHAAPQGGAAAREAA